MGPVELSSVSLNSYFSILVFVECPAWYPGGLSHPFRFRKPCSQPSWGSIRLHTMFKCVWCMLGFWIPVCSLCGRLSLSYQMCEPSDITSFPYFCYCLSFGSPNWWTTCVHVSRWVNSLGLLDLEVLVGFKLDMCKCFTCLCPSK